MACSEQCSMCSMSAFAGAGAVQFAVYTVQCVQSAKDEDLAIEKE